MCSASREQKEAFKQERQVSGLLSSTFSTFAGDNEAILKDLTGHLSPIADAGPSQFGLSPAAEAAERTMTAEQMNAAGAQTTNAVRSAISSRGGGREYLPSGGEDSILGALAQDTAVKEALAQSRITEKGYDIGRQNWEFATKGLATAPGELENPVTSAGSAAMGGAEGFMKGANDITEAQRAWIAPTAGIIGAAVKGATAAATGGASAAGGGGGAFDFTTPGGFYSGES